MFVGLLAAVLTIVAHSGSKFGRVNRGWTIASGVFLLMALLPLDAADLDVGSINSMVALTRAAIAWAVFFGLYYVFSGRKRKPEVAPSSDQPAPPIAAPSLRARIAKKTASWETWKKGVVLGLLGAAAPSILFLVIVVADTVSPLGTFHSAVLPMLTVALASFYALPFIGIGVAYSWSGRRLPLFFLIATPAGIVALGALKAVAVANWETFTGAVAFAVVAGIPIGGVLAALVEEIPNRTDRLLQDLNTPLVRILTTLTVLAVAALAVGEGIVPTRITSVVLGAALISLGSLLIAIGAIYRPHEERQRRRLFVINPTWGLVFLAGLIAGGVGIWTILGALVRG